jgi:outer membrane protein TolC
MSYYGLGEGLNGLPDHLWTLGFQVSWTPLDWGKRRSEAAAKTEAVEQARVTFQEAQAQAQVDVNNQLRRQREARAQVQAAHAAQDAARERMRVTMNQYRLKAALLKDVLQAQAALADADRQVQEAALSYLTAQSNLRKAIGVE